MRFVIGLGNEYTLVLTHGETTAKISYKDKEIGATISIDDIRKFIDYIDDYNYECKKRTPWKESAVLALRQSIAHWERLYANKPLIVKSINESDHIEGPYGEDCACCNRFDGCIDCPISLRTGKEQCYDTPYYRAKVAYFSNPRHKDDDANIKKQIDFLKETLQMVEDEDIVA